MQAMLDSHPQLIVFPEETSYFRTFHPKTAEFSIEKRARLAEDLILHVFNWDSTNPHPSQGGFPDRDYRDIEVSEVIESYRMLLSKSSRKYADILPAAVLAFGDVSGQRSSRTVRWVEKTPYNEFYADLIFSHWPEARCLHIVRDPRDNFASYRRKHPDWGPRTFAKSWSRSIEQGWWNQRRYGSDRYRVIRYEDLVRNPERLIAIIIEYLGIEDDPTLRRPTRNGHAWAGNSMFGQEFDTISSVPLGRHMHELGTDAGTYLESLLNREMGRLAYSRYYPRRLLPSIAALAVRQLWGMSARTEKDRVRN